VILPDSPGARTALAGVLGAFEAGGGLDPLQESVLHTIARDLYGITSDDGWPAPLSAAEFLATGPDTELREGTVCLMVVLEMLAHPLPPAVAAAVDDYAGALHVSERMVHAARDLATQHLLALHADIERSTWYTNQKVHGTLHGQFLELVRSKLAYTGLVGDRAIARRWEALRSCPPGSWGKGVADFYDRHGFPFPGEPKGIEETGATHDFVHVLAEYDATPIGEIEVFAFIATSMRGSWGLAMLCFTLGIFQNDSIHSVGGKRVAIARADTLSDPGNVDRFAEALARGRATNVDVMAGVDHFAYAAMDLAELRERFGVRPLVPG